jgi:hypothetical protein
MNKITFRAAYFLLLIVLAAAPVMAKSKSRLMTIGQDFTVGSTTLKAGTYRFTVDTTTNELTVTDKQSKEVFARVAATAAQRNSKAGSMDIKLSKDDAKTLISIAFPGDKVAYVVSSSPGAGS